MSIVILSLYQVIYKLIIPYANNLKYFNSENPLKRVPHRMSIVNLSLYQVVYKLIIPYTSNLKYFNSENLLKKSIT